MLFLQVTCMTAEDFVRTVRIQASDGATEATIASLEAPVGRTPSQRDSELSKWYGSLAAEHQSMVQAAVREAAQQAVFSFLVLLDGVASIGKGRDGKLQLFYSERERGVLLTDPAKEELHNLFNKIPLESRSETDTAALRPYDVGPASELLGKSVPGDGLEIHHVPQKHFASLNITGYNSDSGTAIALPKADHRRMPPS